MGDFHYMDMRNAYQYQQPYHPASPAHYPQQLSANHYYYPQHLPPPLDASLYPGMPSLPLISSPAGRTVSPMPASNARRSSHHINQPQRTHPSVASVDDATAAERHCAFVFGWDFTQPDEAELDSQPEYTPSPQSSNSGKRQKLYDSQASRGANALDRVPDRRQPSSQRANAPQYPRTQYNGMQRTPLSDHAYDVVMQTMDASYEPPEAQPLSDLHRRLFPPNCHISYQQDSQM